MSGEDAENVVQKSEIAPAWAEKSVALMLEVSSITKQIDAVLHNVDGVAVVLVGDDEGVGVVEEEVVVEGVGVPD